jgi:serine/threonine protein kinase
VDSHQADIRADIYALGATCYFCLTGRTPFAGGTVAQKLIWQQSRQPKPIQSFRSDVPEGLLAVIEKMMAKNAAQRYQTPGEAAEALSAWMKEIFIPPAEAEMPQLCPAARGPESSSKATVYPSPATLPQPKINTSIRRRPEVAPKPASPETDDPTGREDTKPQSPPKPNVVPAAPTPKRPQPAPAPKVRAAAAPKAVVPAPKVPVPKAPAPKVPARKTSSATASRPAARKQPLPKRRWPVIVLGLAAATSLLAALLFYMLCSS